MKKNSKDFALWKEDYHCFVHVFLWNSLQNVYLPIILVISFLFPHSIKNSMVHRSESTMLVGEHVSMSKQAYSCEQEGILKHIPCHVMEFFSIFVCGNYLVMWWNILPCHEIFHDVAKYCMTSHGIFCHITSMVCFNINNGLLTLNMGLA